MPVPLGDALRAADGVTVDYRSIPDGDAGAVATVRAMAALIEHGSVSPIVRRQAAIIAATVPARDYDGQLRAIRAWLAMHVVFLRDPEGTELLHEPELLVASIIQNGTIHVDCDDVAILGGAIGKSIGLLCRIVTVAFRDPVTGAGGPFAHTWAELASPVVDPPEWLDMDTTRTAQNLTGAHVAHSFIIDV